MIDDDPTAMCRPTLLKLRGVSRLVALLKGATFSTGLVGLLFLSCSVFAQPASAHGRLGAAEGRCRLFVGPDYMNFTGYLPEASKNEFCEDIPSTGHMIMVLDAEQQELREMPIEIRIVKDVGGEAAENADLEAVTVAHRDARRYPTGTINFEHVFDAPGYFVGIVTVTGEHGEQWVSRFPFSVGKSFIRDLPVYILLALAVMFGFWIYLRHRPVDLKSNGNSKPPTIDPATTPAE